MDITIHHLTLIATALVASWTTFYLHNRYSKISPVLASASLTLIVALICHYISESAYLPIKEIPYVFIGGTFVGMSTRKKAKSYLNITLSSLFFSIIYLNSSQFFQGYGGALGLSACISVLIVITSSKLFVRSKHIFRKKRHQKNKSNN